MQVALRRGVKFDKSDSGHWFCRDRVKADDILSAVATKLDFENDRTYINALPRLREKIFERLIKKKPLRKQKKGGHHD